MSAATDYWDRVEARPVIQPVPARRPHHGGFQRGNSGGGHGRGGVKPMSKAEADEIERMVLKLTKAVIDERLGVPQ